MSFIAITAKNYIENNKAELLKRYSKGYKRGAVILVFRADGSLVSHEFRTNSAIANSSDLPSSVNFDYLEFKKDWGKFSTEMLVFLSFFFPIVNNPIFNIYVLRPILQEPQNINKLASSTDCFIVTAIF